MMKGNSERTLFLCIVGKGDVPIFEAQLQGGGAKVQKEDLIQFIVHMALDAVEQKVWTQTGMYMKQVDHFNELTVSAFCTAGHTKFMLLHDHKTDESAIRSFFNDLYELYVKVLLNPFYEKNSPITSPVFAERVRHMARRMS